jgi:hypothetical protein
MRIIVITICLVSQLGCQSEPERRMTFIQKFCQSIDDYEGCFQKASMEYDRQDPLPREKAYQNGPKR